MFRIDPASPIRKVPCPVSERQLVVLDGIRFSADMAGIAIDRLWRKLSEIDVAHDASSTDIAEAALDAWSIVDAAHRIVDLVACLPGLQGAPWQRILRDRLKDALDLRDCWQHQDAEAIAVVERRDQAWGALAWAQHTGARPTGRWFLISAGHEFVGSSWTAGGPNNAVSREDSRRIRLLHAGRTLYLGRVLRDIFSGIAQLEHDVREGRLRLVGDAFSASPRRDSLTSMVMLAVVGISRAEKSIEHGENAVTTD